ncbi:STAS/SEC14 domain-containing protein [Halarchaeum sp. P4]|uniref:STAS/SEC14 domain-containing protein n=1 Tax=Halarchaeum sp. P4 TaxID=3421639 RepID=UPI003EBFF68A
MIRRLERSGGDVLGYEVGDELSEAELEAILEDIETTIAEEGAVQILVHMPDVPRPDLDALDEDIGFWLEHGDDIGRYAVVGDSRLLEWVTDVEDHLTSIDLRYFDEDEMDEAWDWLESA